MNANHDSPGYRIAERQAFTHFLRTGFKFTPEEWIEAHSETKFNPWHDPQNGQFTYGPGGANNAVANTRPAGRQPRPRANDGHIASNQTKPPIKQYPDPIGDIIEAYNRKHPEHAPRSTRSASHTHPLPLPLPSSNIPRKPKQQQPDPIGDIIAKHFKEHHDSWQPAQSNTTHRGKSKFPSWPIAGASQGSLNRADKPGEGDPHYMGKRPPHGHHRGIDIKAKAGTPVQAPAGGTVVHISPNPSHSFGYQVVIYHGHGVYTHYAHLQPGSILVKAGQAVKSNQTIARVGRTGNTPHSGDTHLHFEVRLGTKAPASAGGHTANPLDYLP